MERTLLNYKDILWRYLDRISDQVVALLDMDLTIVDCNGGFQRWLGLEKTPVGKNLKEFLKKEEGAFAPFPPDWEAGMIEEPSWDRKNLPEVRVTFLLGPSIIQPLTCHLFRLGDRILLIGEKPELYPSEIISKMSVLNNELDEITRQLNQKNRELEKANAVISRLMNTDPLTDLANRRYFQEILIRSLSFAARKNSPLSLVMADLDHFKSVNDRYGHDQGDQVLIAFSRLLKEHSRTEDLPARFGGEEFLVLLPGTNLQEAAVFAERIRLRLMEIRFQPGPERITASFGVTSSTRGDTPESLIKRVDTALYQAKGAGRNRVVLLPAKG
jgi:diguanylate cyclase (GGDEF)-like protein